jgi:hypothetical protein
MAEIVLVHGIDQQQKTADRLEEEWLPDLAGGVRIAGFPDVADRIWRDRGKPGGIEARMAFYGHLFLKPGQQGDDPGEFTPEESAIAEVLAMEWLRHAAERATKEKTRQTGGRELAYLTHEMGAEQGAGRHFRSAAKSLAKISWFWPYGFGFAERFVVRALAQVTRYLTQEDIRAAALKSVADLIGPESKIIIGHSLGSVVAFEAAHLLKHPLPLLITLGSPLGLQNIVYQRLRPQPPAFPPKVKRWVNIADQDDLVAAEPNLEGLFATGKPEGASLEGGYTVDNGAKPHNSSFYIGKIEVGVPVGTVFSPG